MVQRNVWLEAAFISSFIQQAAVEMGCLKNAINPHNDTLPNPVPALFYFYFRPSFKPQIRALPRLDKEY